VSVSDDYAPELAVAERAALEAGVHLLEWYQRGDLTVSTKADTSPVTAADEEAHEVLVKALSAAFPDDAILSEEGLDDPARLASRRVWIVDPLDGTRDFIARSGEFSVHVGFSVDGVACVGVVLVPVAGVLYAARRGHGAWRVDRTTRTRLHVSTTRALPQLRVGLSRQTTNDRLTAMLDANRVDQRFRMGASTKHVAVAAGQLDATIHLGPGSFEWDTCAPEVVIREAGGMYTDGTGAAFRYNQPLVAHQSGSIASNGACHALLVDALAAYVVS
jgi:3'(2'), 5'-bisphosphate nucleotidase